MATIKATSWLAALSLGALLAGCGEAGTKAEEAGRQVSQRARLGWSDVQAEAARLTDGASERALEAAREKLIDLQAHLAEAEVPDQLRMESVKRQIAKIEAALDVRKLENQANEKLEQARAMKDNAGKSVDEIRSGLQRADAGYRDLSNRLEEAKAAYRDAAARAQQALQSVQDGS